MSISDPISDLLTRIRNALKAEHRYVDIPWSKFKENIARIFKDHHLIESYTNLQNKQGGSLRIYLKYGSDRNPVIKGLKRVSRPGLRRYVTHKEIPHFYGGLGISVLSTSKGILSGKEASQKGLGGELVCQVW